MVCQSKKIRAYRQFRIFAYLGCLSLFLGSVTSCLIRENSFFYSDYSQKANEQPPFPEQKPEDYELKVFSGDTPIAALKTSSCLESATFHEWQIAVRTPVSEIFLPVFIPLTAKDPQLASVRIENTVMQVDLGQHYPTQEVHSLCQQLLRKEMTDVSEKSLLFTQLESLLVSSIPDCQWKLSYGVGWSCQLERTPHQVALDRVGFLTQDLMKRWKRMPYLLSRRLAIIGQLASALGKNVKQQNSNVIQDFCMVAKSSYAEEQPLSLTSKSWLDKFCSATDAQELTELGQIGLHKALQEVEVLVSIADKTNYTGQLKIEISKGVFTSPSLRVKLKPMTDVRDLISGVQTELWEAKYFAEHVDQTSSSSMGLLWKACWHPLFPPESMIIARDLGLAGHQNAVTCQSDTADNGHNEKTVSYILDSVLGETTFLANNSNNYKTLRLPQGQYEYTILEEPEDFRPVEEPTNEVSIKGSVSWLKSTRPTIRASQQLTN